MEATPVIAASRPVIEEESPRDSKMTLSSGIPRPMAMPTALIEAIATEIERQCTRSMFSAS